MYSPTSYRRRTFPASTATSPHTTTSPRTTATALTIPSIPSLPVHPAAPGTHHLPPSLNPNKPALPLLPPATPLPLHPSATSSLPPSSSAHLTTPATAFALRTYLLTYLHTLGWDPSTISFSGFVTQYSWLIAQHMDLSPQLAQQVFLELYDATTPTMESVARAVVGMRGALGCDETVERGLKRLWMRTQGVEVGWAVRNWGNGEEEEGGKKCEVGVVKGERSGWGGVWREVVGRLKKRSSGGSGGGSSPKGKLKKERG